MTELYDLLLDGAAEDRPALIWMQADAAARPWSWTRATLDRAVRQVAALLQGTGDIVAVPVRNAPWEFAACLAVLRAGRTLVLVDRTRDPATLRSQVQATRVQCWIGDGPPDEALRHVQLPSGSDPVGDNGSNAGADAAGCEIATVVFTSGSTGTAKAVPLTYAGYAWGLQFFAGRRSELATDRFLVSAPMFHLNAFAACLAALASGAGIVLLERFGTQRVLSAIRDHGATFVTGVPTMLAMLARDGAPAMPSVRSVSIGSAPLTAGVLGDIARLFPAAAVVNGYGATETGPFTFGPHPAGLPRPPLSIGCPRPGVEVRLEGGTDEGVLWIKAPSVMPGYLNAPSENELRLRDGWYMTGDIVRRDRDGFYYFVGRVDDMFVCGGENIHPSAVERRLLSHPAVAQACVVPVSDEMKGAKPVAFVTCREGHRVDAQALQRHCLDNGPAHEHPREIHFLNEMPMSAVGKIDRRLLTARVAQHRLAA